MSSFLSNSSVGKKLVMSVTGCFLVLFILFHMSMNLTAIFSREAYNLICELLGLSLIHISHPHHPRRSFGRGAHLLTGDCSAGTVL